MKLRKKVEHMRKRRPVMRSFFLKLAISGFTGLIVFVLSRLIIEIFNVQTDSHVYSMMLVYLPFSGAILALVGTFMNLALMDNTFDEHE